MAEKKFIRDVFPLPKEWETNNNFRQFGVRINDAIRTLFARRVAVIKLNGANIETDDHDVADLGSLVKTADLFGVTALSSGNMNSNRKGCFYTSSSVTNIPTAHSYFVISYEYSDSCLQIAFRLAGTQAYFRTRNSGTWNAWKQFTIT